MTEQQKSAWYVHQRFIMLCAVIVPPLAYIIMRLNRQHFSKTRQSGTECFAALMTAFWLLKFIPLHPLSVALIASVVLFFIVRFVVQVWKEQ